MRTVLFVHGTGTRDPAYSLMLERVRTSLAGHATVERCYWGETEGAKLHAAGASIPQYQSTRSPFSSALHALEPEDQEDYEIALWDLLLMDPLVELRLLATMAGNSGGLGLGKVPATRHFDRLAEWNTTLAVDDKLRSDIAAGALSALIPEVCGIVKGSKLLVDAEVRDDEQACRVAAARAVLATAFFLAQERDLPSPARTDADLRDSLVDGFARLLDPTGRRGAVSSRSFIRNHLAKPLLGLAMHAGANVASTWARRRRGAISDVASAAAGDILLYQARGAGIRRFIKEQIEVYEGDVVLLAHSLGGVACVDLLALEKLPQIAWSLVRLLMVAQILKAVVQLLYDLFEIGRPRRIALENPEEFARKQAGLLVVEIERSICRRPGQRRRATSLMCSVSSASGPRPRNALQEQGIRTSGAKGAELLAEAVSVCRGALEVGPAHDAARFTEWLIACKVPAANILVFVSPLENVAFPSSVAVSYERVVSYVRVIEVVWCSPLSGIYLMFSLSS